MMLRLLELVCKGTYHPGNYEGKIVKKRRNKRKLSHNSCYYLKASFKG
jgi:hypothetical protein